MELDRYNKQERIVGIFVCVVFALAMLVFIKVSRGKDWFKPYDTYYINFEINYDLEVNAPVKLLNAKIGKVVEIEPMEENVRITVGIFKDYSSKIKTDSTATVKSPTLIGSEYVSISPGSKDASSLGERAYIKSVEKQSISDMLKQFEIEKTAKMLILATQEFASFVDYLNNPQGDIILFTKHLKGLTKGLDELVVKVNEGKGLLGAVVSSDKLLNEIYDDLNSVKIILKNIEKGSHDFPEITTTTRRGIEEIRQGVENIERVVNSLESSYFVKKDKTKIQRSAIIND